jgi:hypothetical protein
MDKSKGARNKCRGWFNDFERSPLNDRNIIKHIVITAQYTAIFLIRCRRFFASIRRLYHSGRYMMLESLKFLFTNDASSNYLFPLSPIQLARMRWSLTSNDITNDFCIPFRVW